tara:strand:- start:844 stop:1026 length:183 start_codon:yes stop_codon:yes gene_type:complete
MLDLIKRFELIQKKQVSQYMPGSVECVFEYHEKCKKNEDGTTPVCIKHEHVELNKKKSIN